MDPIDVPADPLARGRTSAIFPVGGDRVVKLLEPGFDTRLISIEERKLEAAHDAGAPAPAVHGVAEIDGRPGLIMDRIEGDVLVDAIALDPLRVRQWARVFGSVHVETLACRAPQLDDVRDVLRAKIERVGLPRHQQSAALRVLDAAPEGDQVLHGDVHPGNVILSRGGPMLIDWIDAARGHPGADIARTLWLISPARIPTGSPNRRVLLGIQGLFRRWYLSRVTAGVGVDRRVVDAWRLPVVAARIDEGIEWEDDALRSEVARLTGG